MKKKKEQRGWKQKRRLKVDVAVVLLVVAVVPVLVVQAAVADKDAVQPAVLVAVQEVPVVEDVKTVDGL